MKHILTIAIVTAFFTLMGFGITDSAQAQRRPAGRPRVIQLDEIRIEGRVQKPNAFYILNRSSIGYEVLDLRTSFTRDVIRSVDRDTF